MSKAKRKTTAFDLCVAIQRLIENTACPIHDDEAQPSGQTVEIVQASIDVVGDVIGLVMASGERFVVSVRKVR